MSREDWEPFHGEEQKRDEDSNGSDEAEPRILLYKPKGKACGEPAEGCGHGTNFGDRNKDSVAQAKTDDSGDGNGEDRHGWRAKFRMHEAKRGVNGTAAAVSKKQPGGSHKIAVEDLEQRDDGDAEN